MTPEVNLSHAHRSRCISSSCAQAHIPAHTCVQAHTSAHTYAQAHTCATPNKFFRMYISEVVKQYILCLIVFLVVGMCTTCIQEPKGVRRGIQFPGTGVASRCKLSQWAGNWTGYFSGAKSVLNYGAIFGPLFWNFHVQSSPTHSLLVFASINIHCWKFGNYRQWWR